MIEITGINFCGGNVDIACNIDNLPSRLTIYRGRKDNIFFIDENSMTADMAEHIIEAAKEYIVEHLQRVVFGGYSNLMVEDHPEDATE